MTKITCLLVVILSGAMPGCGGTTPATGGGSVDCNAPCGICGAGEECVSAGVGAKFGGFISTCLKRCATQADCNSAERCASQYLGTAGTFCMSDVKPALCDTSSYDPRWHCDFTGATCLDANQLSRPFSEAANQTCGHEVVLCNNGCAAGGCK